MKTKIVTLCGSYRFIDTMWEVRKTLQEQGCIVLLPLKMEYNYPSNYADSLDAQQIHDRHDQKMLLSDFIYVVNKDGYIGEHTQREVDFAKDHGIEIQYYEEIK